MQGNLGSRFLVELLLMDMMLTLPPAMVHLLGHDEHGQESGRETHSPNRRRLFRKQVDDRGDEQNKENQSQADRQLILAEPNVEWHLELARRGIAEPQHDHR